MATCIGISIGSTNAYVAINGEAVANADGFRNTKTMVTEDLEVGQAAIGKWVRQPESLLDRTSEKFWKALLEDLNETAKSNAGTEIDTAIVNIVIPSSDDKELVTKVGSEIFKNLQVIDNQATVLAQSKQLDAEKSKICLVKIGGNNTHIKSLTYNSKTELYSLDNSETIAVGGNNCVKKIVDYACADFKRKNKYCSEGIPSRGQRKLQREATGAMQALTQTLQANVHVDSIWEGVDMNMNVAKARFDDMVRPVLNEIIESMPEHEAVDRIYVYGGTSSVPLLQHLLKQKFMSKVKFLDAELTLCKLASQLEGTQISSASTITSKTLPYTIALGEHVLLKAGAILPTALHGSLQLEYPENCKSLNLAVQVEGQGDLTEALVFDKSAEEAKKTAKNLKAAQNLVHFYCAHDGDKLMVNLDGEGNSYQFVF